MKTIVVFHPFEYEGTANVGLVKVEWRDRMADKDSEEGRVDVYRVFKFVNDGETFDASALTGKDVIYVLGHCNASSDQLTHLDRSGVFISSEQLFEKLVGLGLDKEYAGKVKIYACFSAVGNPSFASAFAEAMRAKGYVSCKIEGYKSRAIIDYKFQGGALEPADDDEVGHMSKWVQIDTGWVRASSQRQTF